MHMDTFKNKCAYGAVIGVFLKQKLSGYPLTIVGEGNQKERFFIYLRLGRSIHKNF